MKRNKFSTDFKAKITSEGIEKHRTANELPQELGGSVNQINLLKTRLLEADPKELS